MATKTVKETTKEFIIIGDAIQKSLHLRITRHDNEINKCLTTVADLLLSKSNGDIEQLASQAAAGMLALTSQKHLTSDALLIKTQLDRASYLSEERLDLTCIAKNLFSSEYYRVLLDEAIRYGLV
jgi:hypothetical protein